MACRFARPVTQARSRPSCGAPGLVLLLPSQAQPLLVLLFLLLLPAGSLLLAHWPFATVLTAAAADWRQHTRLDRSPRGRRVPL